MADERLARRGVLHLAEQLLELVDHEQQPLRGGLGGEGRGDRRGGVVRRAG